MIISVVVGVLGGLAIFMALPWLMPTVEPVFLAFDRYCAWVDRVQMRNQRHLYGCSRDGDPKKAPCGECDEKGVRA